MLFSQCVQPPELDCKITFLSLGAVRRRGYAAVSALTCVGVILVASVGGRTKVGQ